MLFSRGLKANGGIGSVNVAIRLVAEYGNMLMFLCSLLALDATSFALLTRSPEK